MKQVVVPVVVFVQPPAGRAPGRSTLPAAFWQAFTHVCFHRVPTGLPHVAAVRLWHVVLPVPRVPCRPTRSWASPHFPRAAVGPQQQEQPTADAATIRSCPFQQVGLLQPTMGVIWSVDGLQAASVVLTADGCVVRI